MNKIFRLLTAAAFCCVICSTTNATTPNLNGLWFETNNYPASSVIKFEKFGGGWIGRYSKVSAQQRHFGFAIGEAVIRGKVDGNQFKGEVLLKTTSSKIECPNLTVGWVPIKMELSGSDSLKGYWLQTLVDYENRCSVIQQYWQPYDLERLPENR